MFLDSNAAKNMKLHRTECKNVVVNVGLLAPHFILLRVLQDTGGARYSILTDESTDISYSDNSVVMLLGMCYWALFKQRITENRVCIPQSYTVSQTGPFGVMMTGVVPTIDIF